MKRVFFIKIIEKYKINKNLVKSIISVFWRIYSYLISTITLALYLIIKSQIRNGKSKFISLRITRKYFGHLTIEPAILSSLISRNKNLIDLVSYKSSQRIMSKTVNKVLNSCFRFRPDFQIFLIEHLFNNSNKFTQRIISQLYKPLLPRNLFTREITYLNLLETKQKFPWREYMNIEIRDKMGKDIIIALRTKHYNENVKGVSPQPWRDVDKGDLYHLLKVFKNLNLDDNKIKILSDSLLLSEIKKELNLSNNFELLDQNNVDFLQLIGQDSLVINNGNGIGAASFAIGLKTLYIHHTLYHFWHTSHSNSICFPSLFYLLDDDISMPKSLELAFSSKEIIPFDFEKNFYKNNININSIKDIKTDTLSELILESIITNNKKRISENYLGCEFLYSCEKEKDIWKLFISKLPRDLRVFHKNITLKISETFLSTI